MTQILGWITIFQIDLYYYDDCICDMRLNFQCPQQNDQDCLGLTPYDYQQATKIITIIQFNIIVPVIYKFFLGILMCKLRCNLRVVRLWQQTIGNCFKYSLYLLIFGYFIGGSTLIISNIFLNQINRKKVQFNTNLQTILLILIVAQFLKGLIFIILTITIYLIYFKQTQIPNVPQIPEPTNETGKKTEFEKVPQYYEVNI
ncbi:hypothetical protein pb186bvf_005789 [Paramecium bursaria]